MIFFTFLLSTHLIFSFSFGSFPALANNTSSMVDEVAVSENIQNIIKSILFLRDPLTNISPSHWNHPGYEKLAFTYDKAVDALVLEASGYQSEAEQILDYFITRLDIPIGEVCLGADTNDVYGILKLFKSSSSPEKVFKSFVNALDITSLRTQGRGRLEFWTTPGPISFMIFAMLKAMLRSIKIQHYI